MKKTFNTITTIAYSIVAAVLLILSIIIIAITLYNLFIREFDLLLIRSDFVLEILEAVGSVVIAVAIIDVAKYMIEEEVFKNKELRKPEEAREILTKIMVIISIAVAIEGLIYIVKAGSEDVRLLVYPSFLICTATFMVIGLGLYQRFSISAEKLTDRS